MFFKDLNCQKNNPQKETALNLLFPLCVVLNFKTQVLFSIIIRMLLYDLQGFKEFMSKLVYY